MRTWMLIFQLKKLILHLLHVMGLENEMNLGILDDLEKSPKWLEFDMADH